MSTAGSDLLVVLDGGSGRFAAADRIGQALPQPPRYLLIRCPRGTPPPQPTPELLQGFDTATQITALAHWLRHQPSPALPLAARAFALARLIGLPPAPLNAASCFGMPCASPSGAPPAPPAPGSPPRLFPASGWIVGCRGCMPVRRASCDPTDAPLVHLCHPLFWVCAGYGDFGI